MAENRIKRDATTRTNSERKKSWTPPTLLPDPEPEAGYKYRWIRVSSLGNVDAKNISSRLREGWEPVKAEAHPEITTFGADKDERFKDNIVIGGLLLCKAPEEMVEARNDYYERQAKSQMDAVDNNFMRENDPRMPLFKDRKTKVTFGDGS